MVDSVNQGQARPILLLLDAGPCHGQLLQGGDLSPLEPCTDACPNEQDTV